MMYLFYSQIGFTSILSSNDQMIMVLTGFVNFIKNMILHNKKFIKSRNYLIDSIG